MKLLYPTHVITLSDEFTTHLKRFFLLIIITVISLACLAHDDDDDRPIELIFKNGVLISGVAGQDGAVYKFPRVDSKIDALVTIVKRSDPLVGIVNIDVSNAGWDKAFQPQVTYNNNTTPAGISDWWAEFEIRFVKEGTNIPTTVRSFDVSGIDIDGNAHLISENVTFFGSESYTLEANSLLNLFNVLDPITGLVIGKKFSGPVKNFLSIDTSGTAVMVTNSYKDVNKFTIRAGGSSIGASGASDRLYAFWFKGFRYTSAVEIFLPVKLNSFNAKLNKQEVTLTWAITEEKTFSHYQVEKSTNGTDFKDAGIVFSSGFANTLKEYSFDDAVNASSKGIIYYRLKIVDAKGSYAYSATKVIRLGMDKASIAISTYPNPVTNELRITIPQSWQDKKVSFAVYNANGHVVRQVVNNRAGQTEVLPVSDINGGVYFVKAATDSEFAVQRIVKSK